MDILDNKLKYAEEMGATHCINGGKEDVVSRVQALTGGFGADYAFEVISHPKTIQQAIDSLRKGGVMVIVGMSPVGSSLPLDTMMMMRTSRVVMGTAYGNIRPLTDFPRILELYRAGKLKLASLVSRRFKLDEVNDALRALGAGEVARGVIQFD